MNRKYRIVGTVPLVMHNGQLANPMNTYAKQMKVITSKRTKTDADYLELARLGWFGGLYLANGEPCIPGEVLEAMIVGKGGAARKQKKGGAAAIGITVWEDFPLEYEGPRDIEELWKIESFQLQRLVRVQQSKVLRTRPIFHVWAANVEIGLDTDYVAREELYHWMEVGGKQIGLMDWRPKYGRFSVEQI